MVTETDILINRVRKKINKRLAVFFEREIKKAAAIDPSYEKAVRMVADFTLRGGKRVRAALMYYGYIACGGRRTKAILDAALSMELAHSFLLIHDDIIDNDTLRRGKPTLHKEYEKLFWTLKILRPEQLGVSLAMLCGDIAYTMANKILCESDFDPRCRASAMRSFQLMINHTAAGEIMDITKESKEHLTIDDIIKTYKYKTAKYTIEGPLLIGAQLAEECRESEKCRKIREALSQYAILLGVAFQIHDDIIGIYGNSRETGKEVGSDLRDGKKTILIQKTLENADAPTRQKIENILGSQNISKKDLAFFKKTAEKTEALAYCSNLANNLSVQAKEIIVSSSIGGAARDFFLGSAQYIIERKK